MQVQCFLSIKVIWRFSSLSVKCSSEGVFCRQRITLLSSPAAAKFPAYCNNFVHKESSFDNAFVYLLIINTEYMATNNSVIGIANHMEFAPATIGNSIIRIPLTMQPLKTDTQKAALGFIST